MEVHIGVQNSARELSLETDLSASEIAEQITKALDAKGILTLTDTKGRQIFVPTSALAYLEVGPEAARKVGFGSL